MGKDWKQQFIILRDSVACGQRRTDWSLMTRKAAFGQGPLTILPPREPLVHLAPIVSFRRTTAAGQVNRNQGAANAKLDAGQRMVMFCIACFVCQNTSRPETGSRLSHGRGKIWGILAWTKTDHGTAKRCEKQRSIWAPLPAPKHELHACLNHEPHTCLNHEPHTCAASRLKRVAFPAPWRRLPPYCRRPP